MKLYVVAHCILNPLVRVKGLTLEKHEIHEDFKDKYIIQLPCPELIYFGALRWEVSKEQLDFYKYRRFCRKLFLPIADMLEQLKECEIIIIGVAKSPSCGAHTTTLGYRGGRIKKTKHEHVPGKGIFFEEIKKELEKRGIEASYKDI